VVRIVDGDRYVAVASHRGSLTNRPGTPIWSPTRGCDFRTAPLSRSSPSARSAGTRSSTTGLSPSGSGRRFPNTDGLQLAATSRSWSSNPSPPEQQPRELARSRVSGLTRLVEQLPHIPYSAVRQAFSCVRARLSVETLSLRYPGAVVWQVTIVSIMMACIVVGSCAIMMTRTTTAAAAYL
jgi:hypothetical protein